MVKVSCPLDYNHNWERVSEGGDFAMYQPLIPHDQTDRNVPLLAYYSGDGTFLAIKRSNEQKEFNSLPEALAYVASDLAP